VLLKRFCFFGGDAEGLTGSSTTTGNWEDFSANAAFNAARDQVTVSFVDGGAGDDDGAADGWIVDPSGLSSSASTSTSSSGGGGGGGGCFIATATFGSDMESHVKILRDFRDRFLITNPIGHAFVDFYYAYSPPVTDFIAKNDSLGALVQWRLIPLVAVSWMTLQIGSAPTLACILIMFIGLVYIVGIRRKYKK
jgi:hypothetical protein